MSKSIYFDITLENEKVRAQKGHYDLRGLHKKASIFIIPGKDGLEQKETKKEETIPFCTQLKTIITTVQFLIANVIRAIVLGECTAFHFWIGDYMKSIFYADTKKVFITYSIMSISGPFIGVVLCMILTKCIGGYDSDNGPWNLLICQFFETIAALFIPFAPNFQVFFVATFINIIFGSITGALAHGICTISLEPALRGVGISLANLFSMLCTSGPFTVLYGVINDRYKDINKKLAMMSLVFIDTVGLFFVLILAIYNCHKLRNKPKPEKGEEMIQMNDEEKGGETTEGKGAETDGKGETDGKEKLNFGESGSSEEEEKKEKEEENKS
ncbi:MAG: hypothetical protein MJ252_16880 [archaeon]|nr:hypothetical protein [archaeon]